MFDWTLPRSVTVTGSAGLIGQHAVAALRTWGVHVVELDLTLGHDLSNEDFIASWFSRHETDALVNAFADNDHVEDSDTQSGSATYLDYPLERFGEMMQTNVTSLFSVCREFLRAHPSGNIVNFASIYGLSVPPRGLISDREKSVSYGVSKAAVIQLTRHLAVYAAPDARVNCIVPGGVRASQPQEFVDAYARRVPLKRMASRDDLLGPLAFLLSSASAYVTGSAVVVDGGWLSS